MSKKPNKKNGRQGRNNGRKPHSKTEGNDKDVEMEANPKGGNSLKNSGSSDNDPKWYMKNEQLFRDAASYYISNPLGVKLDWRNDPNTTFGLKSISDPEKTVPGIMALHWVPSTGSITVYNGSDGSYQSADIIQTAAKDVFNFTVHANSRNVEYEPADTAMLTMAADSIFNIIAAMTRIYGVARVYDQQNKYLGDAILKSLGIDGDALRSYGLSDFRASINDLIARASTIWIPDRFDFVKRHYWLNSLLYCDSPDATSQIYGYKQDIYFKWSPRTSTEGSQLLPKDFHEVKTPVEWISTARELIDAIMFDSDPQTMMGDFLKAYGAENIFQLQPISEDYIVIPTFNEEVLLQIHNTDMIFLSTAQRASLHISQIVDTQTIYEAITSGVPSAGMQFVYPGATLLDFPTNQVVSAENVMVATRNKTVSSLNYNVNLGVCVSFETGTELFTEAAVYQYKLDGSLSETAILGNISLDGNGKMSSADLAKVARLSKFDYAPMIYVTSQSGSGATTTWELAAVLGDINHGCVLDPSDLRRLHQVAIMSEWNVPNIK